MDAMLFSFENSEIWTILDEEEDKAKGRRRTNGYVFKLSTLSVTPPKTENTDCDRTFLESHALSILPSSPFLDTPKSEKKVQDEAHLRTAARTFLGKLERRAAGGGPQEEDDDDDEEESGPFS